MTKLRKTLIGGFAVLGVIGISAFFLLVNSDNRHMSVHEDQPVVPVETKMTIQELGELFWPDSRVTEIQQEEALKRILGKRVTWEISVAQVQREGSGYLVQGQSSRNMIGTFSYVTTTSEAEKQAILNASRDTKLKIDGIVQDMRMRHIVLKPAQIIITN